MPFGNEMFLLGRRFARTELGEIVGEAFLHLVVEDYPEISASLLRDLLHGLLIEPIEIGIVVGFAGFGKSVEKNLTFAGALRIGEETMAVLGGAKAHSKEEELWLGSEDRQWPGQRPMCSVDSSGFRYASPCRPPVFQVPGKSQDRKFTAAMAILTPKSTPASTRFEPPSPNAKVSPATTIATKDSPRAIVLVNACCRTLTAFPKGIGLGHSPAQMPLMQDQSRFLSEGFLHAGEFLSDDASRARIGIRKGNLSPDLVGRDGERREPNVEVAASRREAALELHEYAQSPVAESRMLSASSDQP